jgi:hypothetical protein
MRSDNPPSFYSGVLVGYFCRLKQYFGHASVESDEAAMLSST